MSKILRNSQCSFSVAWLCLKRSKPWTPSRDLSWATPNFHSSFPQWKAPACTGAKNSVMGFNWTHGQHDYGIRRAGRHVANIRRKRCLGFLLCRVLLTSETWVSPQPCWHCLWHCGLLFWSQWIRDRLRGSKQEHREETWQGKSLNAQITRNKSYH